jgi:hypothetical protein
LDELVHPIAQKRLRSDQTSRRELNCRLRFSSGCWSDAKIDEAASPLAEAGVRANAADQAIGYIPSDVNEVFTISWANSYLY